MDTSDASEVARWSLILAAASWQGMNGGTAKEATLSIAALNLLGIIFVLCSEGRWRMRLSKLTCISWANVLLLLRAACVVSVAAVGVSLALLIALFVFKKRRSAISAS